MGGKNMIQKTKFQKIETKKKTMCEQTNITVYFLNNGTLFTQSKYLLFIPAGGAVNQEVCFVLLSFKLSIKCNAVKKSGQSKGQQPEGHICCLVLCFSFSQCHRFKNDVSYYSLDAYYMQLSSYIWTHIARSYIILSYQQSKCCPCSNRMFSTDSNSTVK